MIGLAQRYWIEYNYSMDTKFKKGMIPWNKGTKGVMKVNLGSFKKGDNVVPLEIRFWDKVKKTESCWLWVGSVNNKNYGRINVGGKSKLAHRVSYEMKYGEIKNGLQACHKCDNTICVNPEHIFIGTQEDNNKDRDRKGRACLGEKRTQSKLDNNKVDYIRKRYSMGDISQRKLAKDIGISQSILCDVINKKRW